MRIFIVANNVQPVKKLWSGSVNYLFGTNFWKHFEHAWSSSCFSKSYIKKGWHLEFFCLALDF